MENVVAEWAKIMTGKLVGDGRVQKTVEKALFGSRWQDGPREDTTRKVPFYKKIPGKPF